MKKILTTMTAMTLALQSNDSLGQELDKIESDVNEINDTNNEYFIAEDNENTLGASGSFLGVFQTVDLAFDTYNNQKVNEGDVLIYDIWATNNDSINASGVFIDVNVDSSTSLFSNAVNTSQGTVIIGDSEHDTAVIVDLETLDSNQTAYVSYAVKVGFIPDGQIMDITSQALLSTANIGSVFSDDPNNYTSINDPTLIKAYGQPTLLFDEINSGDLTDHFNEPTPIILKTEIERITGEIGGYNNDLEDCFQFDISESRTLTSVILEDINLSSDNPSTSFQMFTGLPPIKLAVGDLIDREITENNKGEDLLPYSSLGFGTYSICLIEGTPGQTYSLVIEAEITDSIFKSGFD